MRIRAPSTTLENSAATPPLAAMTWRRTSWRSARGAESFRRRDTYSRRSAYPGYIWAILEVAASYSLRELMIIVAVLSCAACGQSSEVLTAFRTEQQAQEHCPNDAVVWVDPQRAGYHLKGRALYARSDAGRYACRGEAERAGMREMPN
jgi:hypothetical protein